MRIKRVGLLVPRIFFIYLYLYPIPVILIVISIAMSSLAYLSQSPFVGIFSLLLAMSALYRVLGLRKISDYVDKGAVCCGPKVAINIHGPAVDFSPLSCFEPVRILDLGDRPMDLPFSLKTYLHNLGGDRAEKVQARIAAGPGFKVDSSKCHEILELKPGQVVAQRWVLLPIVNTEERQVIKVIVEWEGGSAEKELIVRSCFDREKNPPLQAIIERWPNGARAAVAWRADIDGFGELSNIGNLSSALNWSKFFRIPPSIFISGRLNLDFDAWEEWRNQFPEKFEDDPDRKKFDEYLSFLTEIKANNHLQYPLFENEWPCAQIGNHMYYHYFSRYGYDASPDTGWKNYVSPGDYNHSWERLDPSESSTLTEIEDNLEINEVLIERWFGSRPTTWSAPADKPHHLYPRALENTGIIGSSEASPAHTPKVPLGIAPYRPGLGETFPFHPEGTRVVETGAHIYKHDPHTVNQTVSLKKAVRRALKRKSQVTFLIHPHLRQPQRYGGEDSVNHFQEILRFLVEDLGPSVWITTHHWIVEYWEYILCPKHKSVSCVLENGEVFIENTGRRTICDLPVDIFFKDGKRACFMIQSQPGSQKILGETG